MLEKELLQGLKVLDLTSRLPGPLAGYLLSSLGADVTKVENRPDPFKENKLQKDPSFNIWYRQLNTSKKVLKSPPQQDFEKVIKDSSIFLYQGDLKKHIHEDKLPSQGAFIQVAAFQGVHSPSTRGRGGHDLDTLAALNLLKLHIRKGEDERPRVSPPFLPTAGICFGQGIALKALAAHMRSQQDKNRTFITLGLRETCEEVLSLFYPKELQDSSQRQFLHNGLFPCYNIYRLKDENWVALAAIEEKYWKRFTDFFKLPLRPDDRFDTAEEGTFQVLENFFSSKSFHDIKEACKQNMCLEPL